MESGFITKDSAWHVCVCVMFTLGKLRLRCCWVTVTDSSESDLGDAGFMQPLEGEAGPGCARCCINHAARLTTHGRLSGGSELVRMQQKACAHTQRYCPYSANLILVTRHEAGVVTSTAWSGKLCPSEGLL